MNLPKQTWQYRFNREFEGKPLYSNSARQFCYYDFSSIKSFISQILEERDEQLVGEINMNSIEDANGMYGLIIPLDKVITLIKK